MDTASYDRSRPVASNPLPSSSISFGMTLVMAIACGVAVANIYYNQSMLGIMEAAFPGQLAVIGLVPTATQLGSASAFLLRGWPGRGSKTSFKSIVKVSAGTVAPPAVTPLL